MIKYQEFEKKYEKQIYEFILATMKEELIIEYNDLLENISDLKNIEKNHIKNGGGFWIAIDTLKDEVIGTVAIKKKNEFVEFKRYYIKKEYRNKKIGYDLYNIAEKFAIMNSIKEMYLVSGKELIKAHKIYEKNGWVRINKYIVKNKIKVREGAYLYKKVLL